MSWESTSYNDYVLHASFWKRVRFLFTNRLFIYTTRVTTGTMNSFTESSRLYTKHDAPESRQL